MRLKLFKVGLKNTETLTWTSLALVEPLPTTWESVENRRMVRFRFSNNWTTIVCNSVFHLIRGFPSCRNSIFRLPHMSIISPYCTVAHGPVVSVVFILTPVFAHATLASVGTISCHRVSCPSICHKSVFYSSSSSYCGLSSAGRCRSYERVLLKRLNVG